MDFGFNKHPHNHIHTVKPFVALPYYQLYVNPFQFNYTSGINAGSWRWPAKDFDYIPPNYIVTQGWIEPYNLQIELHAHTFDNDYNITNLTMRYELMCFMDDGTIEYKLIDEFDVMPYKTVPGVLDGQNHLIFKRQKIFFISSIQPRYKNMFKMAIRIKNVASTQSRLNNESVLSVFVHHRSKMEVLNNALINAGTQT